MGRRGGASAEVGVSGAGARRSPKVRPSRALGARAPVERSGWRGIGPRRRVMAAGGRLEDVSEAPSPVPAIPASCAGLRGAETAGCERPRAAAAWTGGDAGCAGGGEGGDGTRPRARGAFPDQSRRRDAAPWARGSLRPAAHVHRARLWFRNWEPHVTRAGLTVFPERGRQAGGGLQAPGEPDSCLWVLWVFLRWWMERGRERGDPGPGVAVVRG